MTRNQIAYEELREKQRANLAQEAETARANRAKENLTAQSNEISYLGYSVNRERASNDLMLGLANLDVQRQKAANDYEVATRNLNLQATKAANDYYLGLAANQLQSARNAYDYTAKMASLAETERSNKAREEETYRHNVATEFTNTAKTGLEMVRTGLGIGTAFVPLLSTPSIS